MLIVLIMGLQCTARAHEPSQRALGSQVPAQASSEAAAAAGLLALNPGSGIRRSRSRSQWEKQRKRGSSTTASASGGEAGGTEEDDEMELDSNPDLREAPVDSNAAHRHQRGLEGENNVPDSLLPSAQADLTA